MKTIFHMIHAMKYLCQNHLKTCKIHINVHGFRIGSKLMQIILATFACILRFAGFIKELLLIQKINKNIFKKS